MPAVRTAGIKPAARYIQPQSALRRALLSHLDHRGTIRAVGTIELRPPLAVQPQVQAIPQPEQLDEQGRAEETSQPLRWWQGWSLLLLLPTAVILAVPATWPRWAFMWTLAFAIYAGCKWLTWRRTPVRGVSVWRHAGYLLAWPGLDAVGFLNTHPASCTPKPKRSEWLFAGAKLALGILLLFVVARLVPARYPYLVGWVGMIGIVMVLHFGIFHLLSCAWRSRGVAAKPLMNWPLASVSVSEFWGRRWNTAFRDLTHRFLFRPLTARFGARPAIGAGFLFSGLVHDLVISVPVGGGYGGPTLFFVVQGAALFVEHSILGRKLGLGQGWRGWLFTLLVLLVPVCGLFHPPFVRDVVVPFLRALGAI
jgi:hypothetical protein